MSWNWNSIVPKSVEEKGLIILSPLRKKMFYWFGAFLLAVTLWVAFKPKKEKSFAGQIVLITGAGSGIGRLLALEFTKLKCKLVLLDINSKGIDSVAKEIEDLGGSAKTYVCDVSDKEKVRSMAEQVKREVGKVDVLINNAVCF